MHISYSICAINCRQPEFHSPIHMSINHFHSPPSAKLYSHSQISGFFFLGGGGGGGGFIIFLSESIAIWVKEDELSLRMTIVLN